MNILLIGSGGREHALAWKITQSPLCDTLWCTPGNAGIAREHLRPRHRVQFGKALDVFGLIQVGVVSDAGRDENAVLRVGR